MSAAERLRILQVIHQFPPHSSQGSEVYCESLANELARTQDLGVFHVSDAPAGWRRELRRERRGELRIYHCIDRGHYARLADRPNPFLRARFHEVLGELQPAIVHFHNYLSLGDPLVSMARASGAKIVYTLHDYGLICPRVLLLRDDGALCTKDRADFFQDCCPQPIRRFGGLGGGWRRRLPALERWEQFARSRTSSVSRTALSTAVSLAREVGRGSPETVFNEKREFYFHQTRRIFADVDLFIAPSRFLLDRYVHCGVPAEKIIFSDHGMRLFAAASRTRRDGPIRFGYIGALHPQKGVNLLVDAVRGLGDAARLDIHGSAFDSPISEGFAAQLQRDAGSNVFFHGRYDNQRVGAILAAIDLLVVPSIWYENSPLTMHEAFIAGTPVLTADRGGMAELVQNGGGLLFRLGDAAHLREMMLRVVEQPALLDDLRQRIPRVKSIEDDAAQTLERYRGLLDAAR